MPDLEITGLPELAEASVQATDAAVVADISANETKQLSVKALIAGGVAVIDDGDIPAVKVGTLTTNQVPTIAIQNLAVTNDKIETSSSATTGIDGGTKLRDGTVTVDKFDSSKFDRGLSVVSSKLGITNVVTGGAGTKNGITYSTEGLITSVGDLVTSDLSGAGATTTALGAVSVPTVGALAIDSNSAISIADVSGLTPGTYASVTVNAKGQVTAGSTSNSASNIPTATTSSKGGVIVPSNSGIDVDGSGNISIETQSGLTAGDYTKLTVSTKGIITAASNISGSDIPAHSAALLTSGEIPANRIGNNAITTDRILNSAVNDSKISGVSGTKVSTGSLLPAAINPSNLDRSINVSGSGNLGINNAVSGGASTKNGISFNSEGLITSVADLSNSDLSNAKASTSALGVVQVGSGLSVTTGGVLSVDSSSVLGANSVGTSNLIDGNITNDKIQTSSSSVTGIDASTKVRDGSITAVKLSTSNIDRSLNISSGNLGINNVVSAVNGALKVNYNAQGLITGSSSISSSDLSAVKATSSAIGVVSVPTSGGLSVSGTGELSLAATTTGTTISGLTYNSFGQITGSTALVSTDIPTSSSSAKGGVIVPSGSGLDIDSSGNISTSTSGVSAGTYQSVVVNNKGVVTSGSSLVASQVPDLSASQITSGSLDAARIQADSIDGTKLSNSSTAIIQSVTQLGFPTAQFTGQLLFDPIDESAWLHDGNAWNPITTLTKGALQRFGTYDPNASQVTFATAAGLAAGLTVGQNLPTASSSVDGGYVVVNNIGTPSGISGITVELKPPDYLLGVTGSSSSNWVRIELSDTVASQQASAISYTPFGQLVATNVQSAIDELETEKVAKAGSTITGVLEIGSTGSLVFEGSSVDNFELTLACANPTLSDKTLTLPDITGVLITDSDTGTVNSQMILDGTILNVDINASAGIQLSKLETLADSKIIVGSSGGVATAVNMTGNIGISNAGLTTIQAGVIVDSMISGSAAIASSKIQPGSTSVAGVLQLSSSVSSASTSLAATASAIKTVNDSLTTTTSTADAALPKAGGDMSGSLNLSNQSELKFTELTSNGSHYLGFKAPASVTADVTFILPDGDGTNGQRLQTDGSGNLSWGNDNATDNTKLPLDGSGTMAGAIAMGTNKITGMGDPTAAQDAATKTYVDTADALKLNLSGGALTGDLTINAQKDLRFADSDSSNWVGLQAPATIASNFTLTLPATDGSTGQILKTDGSGNLGWVNDATNTAAGDLTGTTLASNVVNSSIVTLGSLSSLTVDGDVTFTGASSNVVWDKSANAFTGTIAATAFSGPLTGNVTGNVSGTALSVTQAAQSAITSLGVLTTLTNAGGTELRSDVHFNNGTNTGKDIYWDESDNALEFSDDVKATFGTDSDLQLFHDGNHSYVQDAGTGDLYLRGTNSVIIAGTTTGQTLGQFIEGDGCVFRFNNTIRMATTNTGATVTGTLVADGLTVDTNTLHVDATNNRVGIGNASPTETLHVYQNATDNVNALFEQGTTNSGNLIQFKQTTTGSVARTAYIGHGGDNTGLLMLQNSAGIYLQTGGSNTALTLDSSQNAWFTQKVGVNQDPTLTTMGSTSGTWQLPEVDGSTIGAELRVGDVTNNSVGIIRLASYGSGDDSGGGAIMFTNTRNGSNSFNSDIAAIKGSRESLGKGYLRFFTGNQAANAERMRIDSSGNVGIGVTSPSQKLHVAGTIINSTSVNNTGDQGIQMDNGHRLGFDQSGTRSWTVKATGGNLEVGSGDGNGSFKCASTGGIEDHKGNLRSVPANTQSGSSSYSLVAADAGKLIARSGGNITVADGQFTTGDMVTILNNSAAEITITKSVSNYLYNSATGTDGSMKLAARGMATIYFTAGTSGYVSGAGLSDA